MKTPGHEQHAMARGVLRWLAAGLAILVFAHAAAAEVGPSAAVRAGIDAACRRDAGSPDAMAARMADRLPGGVTPAGAEAMEFRGMTVGWTRGFALPGGRVEIRRAAPGGRLRRIDVTYFATAAAEPRGAQPRPAMTAIVSPDCVIRVARRIVYGSGHALAIEVLDGDLEPTGESLPLNPPVPPGEDPGGLAVALVDSGVNYLLPPIETRLARGADGGLLGYDFWEMDQRPFDSHPVPSPFFPRRHGTRVASVLLAEAPGTRLVPYRYPRPDLSRMADLVADAAAKGIGLVNLSLGSNDEDAWRPFAEAARAHPGILFVVSAGNDARDIDAEPVYPAALGLDNMIVVTSSLADGRLASGANWGRHSVDLLVPGENVPVIAFDGRRGAASGSSFAAPRVAALAARLLDAHPAWTAADLKSAILARAGPPPGISAGLVRHGFLPDPAQP